MRWGLLLAAAMLAPAGPASGQLTAVGAKGGVHWTDFSDDFGPLDTDGRVTWGAGGFVRFALSRRFGIQPELLWVGKGAEFAGGSLSGEIDLVLTYVELPVLARYDIVPPPARVRPYLMIGPYVAFELTCEFEADADGVKADVDCEGDPVRFESNSPLLGILGAAGLDIRLGGLVVLLVEARASLDLTDVNEHPIGFAGKDIRNRVTALYIGVSVPVGPTFR